MGRLGCAVRTGVIDQKNMECGAAALLQERLDGQSNDISLISGRNDHGDADWICLPVITRRIFSGIISR